MVSPNWRTKSEEIRVNLRWLPESKKALTPFAVPFPQTSRMAVGSLVNGVFPDVLTLLTHVMVGEGGIPVSASSFVLGWPEGPLALTSIKFPSG